jgi:hypothetical protein
MKQGIILRLNTAREAQSGCKKLLWLVTMPPARGVQLHVPMFLKVQHGGRQEREVHPLKMGSDPTEMPVHI